jgi:GPI mannosyltransferase 1 subunit M
MSAAVLTSLFWRPIPLFTAAATLRLVFLLYGLWQDANSAVKYTDIDYLVFTDAARYTAQGSSPYDRDTYRYTPLLAWMLLPTAWRSPSSALLDAAWFSFGKIIFAVSDLVAGWLIVKVLQKKGLGEGSALRYASIWLLNPMVATISTRGSSEGLLGVLVMALLWATLEQKVALAAAILGFGVHFKIYPFIYASAIVWWMDDEAMSSSEGKLKPRAAKNKQPVQDAITLTSAISRIVNPFRVRLAVISLATFMGLNIAMYSMYGTPLHLSLLLSPSQRGIIHIKRLSPVILKTKTNLLLTGTAFRFCSTPTCTTSRASTTDTISVPTTFCFTLAPHSQTPRRSGSNLLPFSPRFFCPPCSYPLPPPRKT